jgi:homoserine O-acetyltransferase
MVAAVMVVTGTACHGRQGAGADISSATERRATLLDPAGSFWSQPAPPRFSVAVETTKGTFVLEIERALAPRGVDRFHALVRAGYFDDSRFFRVVPGFIAQFGIAGDPAVAQVWKDRAFPDDSLRARNVRGTIAFAMTGPNTRTTQLFVSLADNSRLDAQGFSPLGRVVEGMDVVDRIYGGYGENAGGGMRAGKQARMMTEGNAHLDRDYPMLDRLIRAYVR